MATVCPDTAGSDVTMSGTPRAGRGGGREGEDIYHLHPIPPMPPLLSRPPACADSMLAYTERVRRLSRVRADPGSDPSAPDPSPPDPSTPDPSPRPLLEVQARHIPRAGPQTSRKPPQRRPLSLDELTGGRGRKEDVTRDHCDRCLSEPPASQRNKEKEGRRIRINFVSTADLFDLVDFSLRSKRTDALPLARAPDPLRLIRDGQLLRAPASRPPARPRSDGESDVDTASLVVHGTSTPRELVHGTSTPRERSQGGGDEGEGGAKEGDWARRERLRNTDPNDSDDESDNIQEEEEEEDDDDDDGSFPDLDLDLIQDKRRMLMQPPKLRFRPKRAKRMKMHRSLLSAIPEDDPTQRPQHPPPSLPQDSSPPVPVLPTVSSLTAIRASRPAQPQTAPDSAVKKPGDRTLKGSGEEVLLPHLQPVRPQEMRAKKKRHQKRPTGDAESGSQRLSAEDQAQAGRPEASQWLRKKDSGRKALPGVHTLPSPRGRSALLHAADTHHKKIRKIIFLRDLP
ncbi:uncharacterized protein LOC143282337 [Babylonia areolata]|uniref:uncharacterized protein LOC143282337 n=1 Tax=Babylonia areolata TaxID=304850 RepID=UPI003FD378AC